MSNVISEVEQAARNWIDAVTERKRWRVQILSKRFREDPVTHVRTELPLRIRRFAEGCPASGMKYAIDYLLSKAPYTGVLFNGESLEGTYLPTLTTWKRDDADRQNMTRANIDGTYTIVQDLVDKDHSDSYEIQTQSSCSGIEETRYEWDAATIEDAAAGSQGVTYAVQAVGRNEDGTFSYQYVCRKAITQHTAEVTTDDDALHSVTMESWDNVYTDSNGNYVNHDGDPISVPAPGPVTDSGNNPTGTVVRITAPSENADCTLKFQVIRETTKNVLVRDHSTHTQFEGQHEERVAGASIPLGLAPDPSSNPGNIKEHTSEKQPDGRYANTVGTKVERAVAESVVEVRVGRRGRRVTVTNTNQAAPASTGEVAIGGTVRVEKTPGNLYNNTVSTWDRSDPEIVAEGCQDSLYEHTDRAVTSGVESIPTDHVTGGTDGKVISRSTEMDDEGSITQTTETKQERSVQSSEESWQVSIDGVTHVVKDRSVQAPASAPSYSRANIGKSVHNEKTPGGWYNVTTTDLDRNTGTLNSESVCSKSIFEHTDASSVTDPNGSVDSTHVDNASNGHVRKRTARLNSSGSVTISTEDTHEISATEAEKSVRKTVRATITTVTNRNGTTPAASTVNVGESSSHRRTPGGLYDLTTVTVAANTTVDSARSAANKYETESDVVTLQTGGVDSTATTGGTGGVYRTKTSELDEYGVAKTVVRETTEQSVPDAEKTYRRVTRGLITTTLNRNGSVQASDPGASAVGSSSSHRITNGGLYDLTTVTLTASNLNDSAYHANTIYEEVDDVVTLSAGSVDDTKPAAASGGVSHSKTSQLDEYGFVRTADRQTTEKPQEDAELSYRRTAKGLITTRTDRNGSTAASDPGASSVGNSSTHRKTNGGLYDLTTVTLTASAVADSARCEKTYFAHVHDTVTPGTGAIDSTEPSDASGGHSYVKTSDLDDNGFVKTVVRDTQEIARADAELSYRRVTRGLITTRTNRSGSTAASDPGASAVGSSSSHRITNGGLYDLTTVTLTASNLNDSAYHARTYTEEVDDTVVMGTGQVDDTAPDAAGGGYHRVKTSQLDDMGFVRTATRVTHEVSRASHTVRYDSDHFSKTKRILDRNKASSSASELNPLPQDSSQIVTKEVVTNPGGSVDETITTVTAEYRDWDFEFDVNDSYQYTHWFVNATASNLNTIKSGITSKYTSKVTSAAAGRKPSSVSVNPSIERNKFGRYDGHITLHCSWHPESAGQTGSLNEVFCYISYNREDRSYSPGVKNGKKGRYVITDTTSVYFESGRGDTNFRGLVNGQSNIISLSGSIDPVTKVYTVNRSLHVSTSVEFEEDD